MTFSLRGLWPFTTAQAIDLADALRRHAQAAPPPVIVALPRARRAAYDRLVDALNRLPRPLAVLGSLSLVGSALVAPDWFAARMDALSDMPEALWWLIGAALSLHFGARYQDRSQAFQRELVDTAQPIVPVATAAPGPDAALALHALATGPNAALEAWRATQP